MTIDMVEIMRHAWQQWENTSHGGFFRSLTNVRIGPFKRADQTRERLRTSGSIYNRRLYNLFYYIRPKVISAVHSQGLQTNVKELDRKMTSNESCGAYSGLSERWQPSEIRGAKPRVRLWGWDGEPYPSPYQLGD